MWFTVKYIFSVFKKIALVSVVIGTVITLFVYFINKDKPKIDPDQVTKNREMYYSILKDKRFETKEGKVIKSVYRAMLCSTVGETCTENPKDGDKFYSKSIFGSVAHLITLPYANPPASGVMWAMNGLQNAGFIPKTYAATGIGFAAISPLANLWKVFRDISYSILVLVMVIIGFMIMFRMKLNPQTVISMENALPRIVIALLLITFSFPIAGFLIDLMYVMIALSISVLSSHGNFFNATEFQNRYLDAGFGEIWMSLFPQKSGQWFGGVGSLLLLAQSIENILPLVLNQILRVILGGISAYFAYQWVTAGLTALAPSFKSALAGIGAAGVIEAHGESLSAIGMGIISLIGLLVAGPIGFVLGYGFLLGIVLFLLLIGTVVLMLFRIFFLLFATYIRILLMVIFSPLFMLFEAIPGKSPFAWWIRNLIAELLTFPVVVVLFIVTYVIVNTAASPGVGASGNQLWQPPFLTDLNPNAFTIILGFGIMFLIPDFIKLVKELLGAKGLPVSLGLGTFFAGAGAVVGGATGGMGMFTSLTQMPIIGARIRESGLYKTMVEKKILPPTEAELMGQVFAGRIEEMKKKGII